MKGSAGRLSGRSDRFRYPDGGVPGGLGGGESGGGESGGEEPGGDVSEGGGGGGKSCTTGSWSEAMTISDCANTQPSIPSQRNCSQSPAGVRPLGVNVWPRLMTPITGYSGLGPDRTSTLSWSTVKSGSPATDCDSEVVGGSGGAGGSSFTARLSSPPNGKTFSPLNRPKRSATAAIEINARRRGFVRELVLSSFIGRYPYG